MYLQRHFANQDMILWNLNNNKKYDPKPQFIKGIAMMKEKVVSWKLSTMVLQHASTHLTVVAAKANILVLDFVTIEILVLTARP